MPQSWLAGLKNRFVSSITTKQEKIAEKKATTDNLKSIAEIAKMFKQKTIAASTDIKGALGVGRNQRQRRKAARRMNKH